jgi:hypothetical protein
LAENPLAFANQGGNDHQQQNARGLHRFTENKKLQAPQTPLSPQAAT